SWVFEDQYALRKKGVGRGLHQSDVICSTVGWIMAASQTLEYGKNYEGYWTGELFVTQLKERIIPGFEAAHSPGYQALIMVDNSQGHSTYAQDALLATCMNVKPGGKQARMRPGWFIHPVTGEKIIQPMIFGPDHPKFPNEPKGMREALEERGTNTRKISRGKEYCDYTFDTLKENMPKALASVGLQTIRKWEHRMKRWMSAYQEGLSTRDAQFKVKEFSSAKYRSH
ncbi:hypothetical protein BKA70DRAFT_1107273, partial [Coprinopsis sp. MPI-PUGE-AT-0042]